MITSFDDSLPMLLHRALDGIMPDYRELFARYKLTEQQWRILRVLWSSQKVTSAELAHRTLLPAPSLVGIIDRLEKKKLVSRLRSVKDRRVVYIVATAEGRALEQEVSPQVQKIDERLRSAVSVEEWHSMEETLKKFSSGMAQRDPKLSALAEGTTNN